MLKLSFHHGALSMIRKPLSFHTRQTSRNNTNSIRDTFGNNNNNRLHYYDGHDTGKQTMKSKRSMMRSVNDACYLVIRCKAGYTLFCACATLA